LLSILPALQPGSINFILTDPPYLVSYKSRDGRTISNDNNDRWLKPAFAQMYRVLERDAFCVSFYGWPKADKFLQAYRAAGFRVVGHFTFPKRYTSTTTRGRDNKDWEGDMRDSEHIRVLFA
jgi:site-specific DNA-methyltransferase (adenine-specific)